MGGFLLYRESITISKENQFPSPSQGIGGGPTNIEDIPMMPPAQMFLTSHEGWVVSYLTGHNINICDHKGFPSPLEVWVVSYIDKLVKQGYVSAFPSPLEVWVGSYIDKNWIEGKEIHGFRPVSRYSWVPTKSRRTQKCLNNCFRPLARLGWFPT